MARVVSAKKDILVGHVRWEDALKTVIFGVFITFKWLELVFASNIATISSLESAVAHCVGNSQFF